MRHWFVLLLLLAPSLSLGQSGADQKTRPQHESNEAKPNPSASSVNPQPSTPTKENQAEQQTPKCPLPVWTDPFWSNWALVLVGGVAAWIALGTLADVKEQAVAAKISAEAAKKSADFAQKAVMISERADILLDGVAVVPSRTGIIDGDAQLKLRYKNFGRTRAKDVRLKAQMLIEGMQLTNATQELPTLVMGVGQEQTISFQSFGECLTEATFSSIMQGKITLRFEAWAAYEDVFGASYTTRDVGTFLPRRQVFMLDEKTAG